ncbi:sigma-70 family RNA polymerase sigma factor [Paracoccus limosus]|uniref:Sigma-70 family RNA polymerase sigma factor n=1 Tax=Paracoccus limosus TaxID=913252 RepID=A0A844H5D4_9RHOB|nr:sigma-70 family RNA polymerase sigma factor [Paracoccus limosus]
MVPLSLQIGALFRSERGRLLRRVGIVLKSQTDAEDLVQDVFVNLLRRDAPQIQQPRNYLTRAATNAALDHLRRKRVREAVVQTGLDPAHQAPAPQPPVETILQSRHELAILRAAIAGLPPKCRVAFLLSRDHGLSMREIAGQMGVSESTVEKHLLKAMLRCRAALQAAGREF